MKLYIGSDHAGYELKFNLVSFLLDEFKQYEVFDCGTYSEDSVDYPNYAEKVCKNVLENDNSLGILICGTGIGMSISANKIKGIRAALCSDEYSAKFSRNHNDSNVLVLGSRVIGTGLARDIVKSYIESSFDGGRHSLRIDLIKQLEN